MVSMFGMMTSRHFAILNAVAAGQGEITHSCEPDLYVGGRCVCDHDAVRVVVRAGLVGPAMDGLLGQRVPARLTEQGRAVLGTNGRLP